MVKRIVLSTEKKESSSNVSNYFRAKSQSARQWNQVGSVIQTLVEEATFDVTLDGIRFRAMDLFYVALIDISWPASEFQELKLERGDSFTVNVDDFMRLLRRASDKDSIQISRSGSDSLTITIENGTRREFELHLIETEARSTPLPKLNYDAVIKVSKDYFYKRLQDVSAVGNHITILSSAKGVIFSGRGDMNKVNASVPSVKDSDLEVMRCEKEEVKSTYSTEYLNKIVRALGEVESISLEYSSKMPLRLTSILGEKGLGAIQFYLAPRVQE